MENFQENSVTAVMIEERKVELSRSEYLLRYGTGGYVFTPTSVMPVRLRVKATGQFIQNAVGRHGRVVGGLLTSTRSGMLYMEEFTARDPESGNVRFCCRIYQDSDGKTRLPESNDVTNLTAHNGVIDLAVGNGVTNITAYNGETDLTAGNGVSDLSSRNVRGRGPRSRLYLSYDPSGRSSMVQFKYFPAITLDESAGRIFIKQDYGNYTMFSSLNNPRQFLYWDHRKGTLVMRDLLEGDDIDALLETDDMSMLFSVIRGGIPSRPDHQGMRKRIGSFVRAMASKIPCIGGRSSRYNLQPIDTSIKPDETFIRRNVSSADADRV